MEPRAATQRAVGPECPQSWYLIAGSDELPRGEIATRTLGGIEIVLYRGRVSGQVTAFAAHCAHAGCHLRHGRVIGDHLQCALHHRVIRADGQFIKPDGSELPTPAQFRLPVEERHGCVFVFAGERALFDLPLPDVLTSGPAATRTLPSQSFPLPWSTLIANGMDIDHLQAVHDRSLREDPKLHRTGPYSLRLDYSSRVTGHHLSDRVMKWIAGDRIDTSITCIGGPLMLVESKVGRHRTFVMLSMCPVEGGSTVRAIAGVAGSPDRLLVRLAVRITAWLFHAFLKKDVGILYRMDWHEPRVEVTLGDTFTRSLCGFFRGLPAFDPILEPAAELRGAAVLRTGTR